MKRSRVLFLVLSLAASGCVSRYEQEDLPPAPLVGEVGGRSVGVRESGGVGDGQTQHAPGRTSTATRSRPRTPTLPYPQTPNPPAVAFADALAAQTLLDRANFSSGCIDGRWGPRSTAALKAWQESQGLPPLGEPHAGILELLGGTNDVMTVHVVDASDIEGLAPVPATWPEKAAMARLGYSTVLELVAEKYHASERLIRELNPGAPWPDPPPGSVLTVPNPHPAARAKASRLVIRLGQKVIEAWDGQGRMVARFPCSIAADKSKRPKGELSVANAAHDPNYTFDPAVYPEDPAAQAIGKKLLIPPGPNNPVGEAWIGLSLPGYGMHGTPKPEDIGITESHGCFRLANWNAEKLLKMVAIGMPVVVE